MEIENKIEKNVDLASLTTFKIGGPAKFFVKVTNETELKQAILWAQAKNEKIYFLGGGSNVLVNDEGVDGLVMKISNKSLSIFGKIITAGAGTILGQIIALTKQNNLTGLEWAIGIPGTIGGAVRGNAGAYGSDISESVIKVKAFDMIDMKFKKFNHEACQFSYRQSLFKENSNLIIWEVKLELSHSPAERIKALMDKYLQDRLKIQTKLPSAGCVFKNLVINELPKDNEIIKKAHELKIIKGGKLGCGYLVDLLEFKGKKIGGALVSENHGNFIVNFNQATAHDVKSLIQEIKTEVKKKFDITLQEEVQYFG